MPSLPQDRLPAVPPVSAFWPESGCSSRLPLDQSLAQTRLPSLAILASKMS